MSRVREILEPYFALVADNHLGKTGVGYAARRHEDDKNLAEAEQAIEAYWLELIGEDEPNYPVVAGGVEASARNALRTELRAKGSTPERRK